MQGGLFPPSANSICIVHAAGVKNNSHTDYKLTSPDTQNHHLRLSVRVLRDFLAL